MCNLYNADSQPGHTDYDMFSRHLVINLYV